MMIDESARRSSSARTNRPPRANHLPHALIPWVRDNTAPLCVSPLTAAHARLHTTPRSFLPARTTAAPSDRRLAPFILSTRAVAGDRRPLDLLRIAPSPDLVHPAAQHSSLALAPCEQQKHPRPAQLLRIDAQLLLSSLRALLLGIAGRSTFPNLRPHRISFTPPLSIAHSLRRPASSKSTPAPPGGTNLARTGRGPELPSPRRASPLPGHHSSLQPVGEERLQPCRDPARSGHRPNSPSVASSLPSPADSAALPITLAPLRHQIRQLEDSDLRRCLDDARTLPDELRAASTPPALHRAAPTSARRSRCHQPHRQGQPRDAWPTGRTPSPRAVGNSSCAEGTGTPGRHPHSRPQ